MEISPCLLCFILICRMLRGAVYGSGLKGWTCNLIRHDGTPLSRERFSSLLRLLVAGARGRCGTYTVRPRAWAGCKRQDSHSHKSNALL